MALPNFVYFICYFSSQSRAKSVSWGLTVTHCLTTLTVLHRSEPYMEITLHLHLTFPYMEIKRTHRLCWMYHLLGACLSMIWAWCTLFCSGKTCAWYGTWPIPLLYLFLMRREIDILPAAHEVCGQEALAMGGQDLLWKLNLLCPLLYE